MTTERYLIINRRGNVRMTSRLTTLRQGEILIRLRVNIDPAVFTTNIPQAELMVNPATVSQGITVRVDTNEPRYFTPDIAQGFRYRQFSPPEITEQDVQLARMAAMANHGPAINFPAGVYRTDGITIDNDGLATFNLDEQINAGYHQRHHDPAQDE